MLLADGVELRSFIQGGTGSFSLETSQPETLPDKFESGTLNLPGIAGTLEGIKFINRFGGVNAVHRKEMYLTKTLKEDLSVIKDVKLYDYMQGKNLSPIVAFNFGDLHSEEVSAALNKCNIAVRSGYHCSCLAHKNYSTDEKGVVRVSPGVFNTKKDVKTFANFINRFTICNKM